MDIYHAFIDLKPGVRDSAFTDALTPFLSGLQDQGNIAGWRLMRRKLGLGPKELGEFHLMIEVVDMAQLDDAFTGVSTRAGEAEVRHHAVNALIGSVTFALYRDFPDPHREAGQERF